jgi:hypothetical protein
MKQPPANHSSLIAAHDTNQIEQHPGRSSFIWLVTVLPGAVVFFNIVADIAGACKVTAALLFDAAQGVVL